MALDSETDYLTPPPSYTDSAISDASKTSAYAQMIQTNTINTFSFPQDFGIYHASGSLSDLWIAKSADSPPLFYISTHSLVSSKASVELHAGPSPASPPIATAQFHGFSSNIDLALGLKNQGRQNYSLIKDGVFSPTEFFDFLMLTGVVERFEWRSSSGPEVTALQGRSHGMKLVRVSTGRVVAAWARPHGGTKKKGKLRFMAREGGELDDRWEVLVVISITALIERARRARNHRATAGGAGAGAAGAGC